MLTFVPVELDADYPVLLMWWAGHKANPVPKAILPRGWFACVDGTPLAVAFLYVDVGGTIAVLEYMTTAPMQSFGRETLTAVKALYSHLQHVAAWEGCRAVISFVKPRSFEERLMVREGWTTSSDDVGHRTYAKPLVNLESYVQPPGGVLQCR